MSQQFTVRLANRPGSLTMMAEALAAREIEIIALGGGAIGGDGHIALITTDPAGTREALRSLGVAFTESETVSTDGSDSESIAEAARRLTEASVNIQSMQLVTTPTGNLVSTSTRLVMGVDNVTRAKEVLSAEPIGVG